MSPRSRRLSFLFIAMLAAANATQASTCTKEIVGYYPAWAQWNSPSYLPANIPYNKLTRINYAFVSIDAAGAVVPDPGYNTLIPSLVPGAHAQNVKVLVAVGGAGGCTGYYLQQNSGNAAWRTTMVNNLLNYILANDFDCMVIDWEFPGLTYSAPPGCAWGAKSAPQCTTDRTNFISLMTVMRTAFNGAPKTLYMSVALPSTQYYGACYNGPAMTMFDTIEPMAYDFHGDWEGHIGHNAQLTMPPGDQVYASHGGVLSGSAAVTYWSTTQAVPMNKILLGVPFYGYHYTSAGATVLYSTASSPATQLTYREISALIGPNWTRFYDAAAEEPYLDKNVGGGIISYDDSQSLAAKMAYGNGRGLGGYMIWEISQDWDGTTNQLLSGMSGALCPMGTATNTPTVSATLSASATWTRTFTSTHSPSVTPSSTVSPTPTPLPANCPVTLTAQSPSVGTGTWTAFSGAQTYTNVPDWSAASGLDGTGTNLVSLDGGVVDLSNFAWAGTTGPVTLEITYRMNNVNMRLLFDYSVDGSATAGIAAAGPVTLSQADSNWHTFSYFCPEAGTWDGTKMNSLRVFLKGWYAGGAGANRSVDVDSLRLLLDPCGAQASPTPSPTVTFTRSFTGTSSATATRTGTATSTGTSSLTATATPTGTPTLLATSTISPSSSASFTPSASPTASSTSTVTASFTGTKTITTTPSSTPSATASFSPSGTATASPSPTPSPSPSPSFTASASRSPTPSLSPSATETSSASPTGTATPTPSATASATASGSITVSPTDSTTATRSSTVPPTATATASPTATATSTLTPSSSPSFTPSPSATMVGTVTPSASLTVTMTPTARALFTGTASATASMTATPGKVKIHQHAVAPNPVTGDKAQLYFLVDGVVDKVRLRIFTTSSRRVREITLDRPRSGVEMSLPLDPHGALGEPLASGSYHYLLEAFEGGRVADAVAGSFFVLR